MLAEIKHRLEHGEIRTHLGVPGLLALMDDKIRRFSRTEDMDELLDLVTDALVVFTQQTTIRGIFNTECLDMSRSSLEPPKKSKAKKQSGPQERTLLPEASGGGHIEHELNPCPRCDRTKVQAGQRTIELPDAVCVDCEKELPEGDLDVQSYITWIQEGVPKE